MLQESAIFEICPSTDLEYIFDWKSQNWIAFGIKLSILSQENSEENIGVKQKS